MAFFLGNWKYIVIISLGVAVGYLFWQNDRKDDIIQNLEDQRAQVIQANRNLEETINGLRDNIAEIERNLNITINDRESAERRLRQVQRELRDVDLGEAARGSTQGIEEQLNERSRDAFDRLNGLSGGGSDE